MKKILFLLLIAGVSYGQDSTGNFYSKNGNVYWQQTYSRHGSFQGLVNEVKRAGILTNIDTFDNTITGQSIEAYFDYKGAGYTTMSVNNDYMINDTYKSVVTIEHFDSSYRVTVSKIMFVNQTTINSGVLSMRPGELTSFNELAIKKDGRFKDFFFKKNSMPKVMEYTFNKIYSLP